MICKCPYLNISQESLHNTFFQASRCLSHSNSSIHGHCNRDIATGKAKCSDGWYTENHSHICQE